MPLPLANAGIHNTAPSNLQPSFLLPTLIPCVFSSPFSNIAVSTLSTMSSGSDEERQHALSSFKSKLLESREWEAKLKALRLDIKGLQKDFDHTEDNIKALQSVGQIIGEVLKQLDEERCMFLRAPVSSLC